MPITECYDEFGLPTTCSNMEYGQQWYDAIQQWIGGYEYNNPAFPSQGGTYPSSENIASFFETHLNPFLNPESGQVATPDQFMYQYGQYLTNLVPDLGSYDRARRMTDLENRRFAADYEQEIGKRMTETGHRGFSGGGDALESRQDYFDKYVRQSEKRAIEEQQEIEGLYHTWGSDFISSLETLQDSAFAHEPNYPEIGDWTFEGCLDECTASQTGPQGWQACLNACTGLGE